MSAIPPVTAVDPEAQSANPVAANLEALKALFPDAFTEGRIDFDVLRQLLGDAVDDGDEKYGLNWSGKRQARRLALTPSLGTLLPAPGDSVDWDTTRNLMIEGDNLEVLKLLQKSYAGKVKLIYIDPPYNTGNDFVYPDDYSDNLSNYLRRTGQMDDDGIRNTSNPASGGRYHTNWLNMMYPRLMLSRRLLTQDGLLLISCDDEEASRIRQVLDDIFGEECFVAQFVWKARQFTDARAVTNVSTDHEYLIAYALSPDFSMRGVGRDESKFSNPDGDERGPWMSRSILGLATKDQRPNLHYDLVDPKTGRRFPPNASTGWRYSPETMSALVNDDRILFPKKDEGRPREKKFRRHMKGEFIAFRSVIDEAHTADGTQEIRDLFGVDAFQFPKPTALLRILFEQVLQENDTILDFFAGSGTSGHAVMLDNAAKGTSNRFILVQLPEELDPADGNQAAAANLCDALAKPRNIAELTKERLRRAAAKIKGASTGVSADLGFRAYKLSTSNLKAWGPSEDLAADLLSAADNLAPGRTEDDLLVELLLKQGIDLTEPAVTRTIAGRAVHALGGGVLVVCLGDVAAAEAEALADGMARWVLALKPVAATTIFFKDAGFQNDQAKTNVDAILRQRLGEQLLKVRSV